MPPYPPTECARHGENRGVPHVIGHDRCLLSVPQGKGGGISYAFATSVSYSNYI